MGKDAGARGVDGPWSASRLTEFLMGCANAVDEELDGQPEIRARVRAIVGASLTALGEVPEGRAEMDRAIESLPPESLVRANTSVDLAQSYVISLFTRERGYRRAIDLFDEALPVLVEAYGEEHERVLLARILRVYAETLLAAETVDIQMSWRTMADAASLRDRAEAALGPNHSLTLLCELRRLGGQAAATFNPPPTDEVEALIARTHASLGEDNLIELFAIDQLLSAQGSRGNRLGQITAGARLTDVALKLFGPRHDDSMWYLEGYIAMLVHYEEFARIENLLDSRPEMEDGMNARGPGVRGYLAFCRGKARFLANDREQAALWYERAAEAWRTAPDSGRAEEHMALMLRDLARLRDDDDLMREAIEWRDRSR